ncbi:MAG: FtsW/RodA/SpoVE family cell cycle protein [Enterocloster sp.]
MVNLIIEVSKYLMILLIAVYTYANFRFFSFSDMERKRKVCGRQNRAMFAIHFLAYTIMCLKTEDMALRSMLLAFYGAQVVFFLCYIYLYRLLYRNVSRLLVNNACMLLCVGFIMLTRLTMAKGLDKAVRQFAIAVISALVAWLIPLVMERCWQLYKLQWVYAGAGLALLLIVWIVGNESFGAQLSLTLGSISIQPSEFVKLSFVFFVASMFYQSTDFRTVCVTTAVAAAHVLILVLSKDLGSALIFFITYVLMLFIATGSWLYLGGGLGLGCLASVTAYGLFDHVRRRVEAWRDPWSDIDNKGYQITQSLFAIGTGGWFGLGLCQGMPGKIPVVEKDFIFAAISEELGGLFALCLLLICLGCFVQFMMIAASMQAVFYKLIAFGLGVEYIVQVFLTVGGVTKFIPSTGVTLPFVSYGGSSMFSTFLLFSIIQGLYIIKRNDEEEWEAED